MKPFKPFLMFAASLSLSMTTMAFAADPSPDTKGPMRDLARVCRPDAEHLCANVEKGGGRKLQCLHSHEAELSPACKDGLAKADAARKGGGAH